MSNYTHQTAPPQFVEANGIRFAYRRFRKAAACLSSSTSTTWDHGLERRRPNGIGSPSGLCQFRFSGSR
jgi:hypothetical protein